MKKRILSLMLIFVFIFSFIFLPTNILAKNTKDKLTDIEEKLENKRENLSTSENKKNSIANQIESFDERIDKLEEKIAKEEKERDKVQASLDKIKKELRKAKEERKEYQDLLEERMKIIYMYGDIGYLDIIFSSKGISDFINKLSTVQALISYDQGILTKLQAVEKEIQTKSDKIENQKKELDTIIANLNSNKENLDTLRIAKNSQLKNVNSDIKSIKQEIEKLENEQIELSNKLANESGNSTDIIYNSDGPLTWPTPGNTRITSEQGYRYHPISGVYKYHSGMDIALSYGDPVVAPASGKVTIARWYGGYGYAVGIDAGKIKGKHVTILLAHNSKLKVKEGQRVVKGQVVAYGGSTGYSTGPHCHFEVHANGVTQNPRKWL